MQKDRNVLKIIVLVHGFCPLKVEIGRFPMGNFCLFLAKNLFSLTERYCGYFLDLLINFGAAVSSVSSVAFSFSLGWRCPLLSVFSQQKGYQIFTEFSAFFSDSVFITANILKLSGSCRN